MTEPAKRKLAIGILTLVIGTTILAAVPAAWNTKVSTTDYNLHLAREEANVVRDSAWKAAISDGLRDVLCEVKKQRDRRCQ